MADMKTLTINGVTYTVVDEIARTTSAKTSTYTATVPVSWGASTPYTQSIAVQGILATDQPVVDIVLTGDADADKLIMAAWGNVGRITTAANSITIYCYDEAPSVAIPIQLKVVR